jgi:hypothetical protein
MRILPLAVLLLLIACAYAVPPREDFIATKAGVSEEQMRQDIARCKYEVDLHISPRYAHVPDNVYYAYTTSLEAQCLRGKGYKVFVGKEQERVVDCRLRDGTMKELSIVACTNAGGDMRHRNQ